MSFKDFSEVSCVVEKHLNGKDHVVVVIDGYLYDLYVMIEFSRVLREQPYCAPSKMEKMCRNWSSSSS